MALSSAMVSYPSLIHSLTEVHRPGIRFWWGELISMCDGDAIVSPRADRRDGVRGRLSSPIIYLAVLPHLTRAFIGRYPNFNPVKVEIIGQ